VQVDPRAIAPSHAEWWRPRPVASRAMLPRAVSSVRSQGRRSAVPFAALACFTFVLLLAPQVRFPVLAPLHLAALAAVVAIGAHLWDRARHREPIIVGRREVWLAVALVAWSLMTAPFSYWPGGSIALLFGVYLKSVAVFWLLGAVIDTRTKLRQLAWALTALAVPLAATAVSNFASGAFIGGGAHQEVERIIGYEAPLTTNPNDLALMLNLLLPLTVALFLIHRKPLIRATLIAAIALDVVAVVATFSRAGFLTMATVLASYFWKLRRRPERIWAYGALGAGLLCLSLLPSGYLVHLGTITNISSDPTGSAQARWSDTVTAARYVLMNPIFGAGLGMNVLALNDARGATWRSVHNVYLEYAADLGLPGLLMFLLLLAGCVASVGSVQRRLQATSAARDLFYLAEGVQLSLAGFAVAAFFHPVSYHFYFYYLAGLAIAVRNLSTRETNQEATPRPHSWAHSTQALRLVGRAG